MTTSGSIANAAAILIGLGSPRYFSTRAMIRVTKFSIRCGVSARVIMGMITSLLAISRSMLAASSSASTKLPSAPVSLSSMTILSGSMYSPSITGMPAARKACLPLAVASITGAKSSYPWRCMRARAASIEAKIRPDIEVVWVESKVLFSLERSTKSPFASTKEACE